MPDTITGRVFEVGDRVTILPVEPCALCGETLQVRTGTILRQAADTDEGRYPVQLDDEVGVHLFGNGEGRCGTTTRVAHFAENELVSRHDTLRETTQIAVCEFEGAKFSGPELDAVDRYSGKIEGVSDCFDGFTVDTIREFGPDDLQGHVEHLRDWHGAIGELYDDLLRLGGGRLTQPAARYMQMELLDWRDAKQAVASAAVEFLGADPMPIDPDFAGLFATGRSTPTAATEDAAVVVGNNDGDCRACHVSWHRVQEPPRPSGSPEAGELCCAECDHAYGRADLGLENVTDVGLSSLLDIIRDRS